MCLDEHVLQFMPTDEMRSRRRHGLNLQRCKMDIFNSRTRRKYRDPRKQNCRYKYFTKVTKVTLCGRRDQHQVHLYLISLVIMDTFMSDPTVTLKPGLDYVQFTLSRWPPNGLAFRNTLAERPGPPLDPNHTIIILNPLPSFKSSRQLIGGKEEEIK